MWQTFKHGSQLLVWRVSSTVLLDELIDLDVDKFYSSCCSCHVTRRELTHPAIVAFYLPLFASYCDVRVLCQIEQLPIKESYLCEVLLVVDKAKYGQELQLSQLWQFLAFVHSIVNSDL